MGNFNRGGRGNDRHGGGFNRRDRDRGGFNRDRGDRPAMHKAVCDACHKDCEVPFKPSSGKPIFCSDCFSKQGGGRSDDRHGGDRRPRFEDRSSSQTNPDTKEILKGIKSLNYKFDELLKALSPNARIEKNEATKFNEGPKTSKKKKKSTPPKIVKQKTPKKKVVAKKPTKKKKK